MKEKVNTDLHAESEDVFERDDVTPFVMSIEGFFVDQFYRNREVNDNHILQSMNKLYAFLSGTLPALEPSHTVEELIFREFKEVNRKIRTLPDRLKARVILRIIKSIRSSSGGVLGNRNYLEMIYSQRTGKGKWADLFTRLESND